VDVLGGVEEAAGRGAPTEGGGTEEIGGATAGVESRGAEVEGRGVGVAGGVMSGEEVRDAARGGGGIVAGLETGRFAECVVVTA
jgi:hypothetical protein